MLGLLRDLRRQRSPQVGAGPTKWCHTCHRFHPRGDDCELFLRTRIAKSGRRVQRWTH